jgi:hypothetical protein
MLTELNSLAITQFINSQVVADNSPLSMTGKQGDQAKTSTGRS